MLRGRRCGAKKGRRDPPPDALPAGRGETRVSPIANLILLPALDDFHARYPDVYLEMGVTERPIDLVGENVDCVIRAGVVSDPSLVARRIGEVQRVLVASPHYLKRYGTPRHPSELEGDRHRMLTYFAYGDSNLTYTLKRGEEVCEGAGWAARFSTSGMPQAGHAPGASYSLWSSPQPQGGQTYFLPALPSGPCCGASWANAGRPQATRTAKRPTRLTSLRRLSIARPSEVISLKHARKGMLGGPRCDEQRQARDKARRTGDEITPTLLTSPIYRRAARGTTAGRCRIA